MRYLSTRGGAAPQRFSDILLEGLAPDGGLYVPESYPKADLADRRAVQLTATAKGRRALEAGRQRRVQHVIELLGGLDAGEEAVIAQAVELLERALARESESQRQS